MTLGGVFQVAGIYLVFAEIRHVEGILHLGSIWRSSIGDLAQFLSSIAGRLAGPFRRRHGRRVELQGASLGMGGSLAAHVRVTRAEGTTANERLDSHQREMAALRQELEQVQQRVDQDQAESRTAVIDVETRLRGEITSIRQLVGDLSGGFRRGRALGGGLILVGTALIVIGVWT
jgi:hypothetical protein